MLSICISVTLGFFDDIVIPVNALQHPSRFDETDQAWVWEYPKEDGEKHDLFMDSGNMLIFYNNLVLKGVLYKVFIHVLLMYNYFYRSMYMNIIEY